MKTVFGHFLEFGTSDGLDIAYDDSAKRFSAFVCMKLHQNTLLVVLLDHLKAAESA